MNIKRILQNILLMALSLAAIFIVLEGGLRVFKNKIQSKEFRTAIATLAFYKAAYPIEYDESLGWIPKPGISGKENVWGTDVTILDNSIRSNGRHKPVKKDDVVIVAVGDSYTFGDEVSDQYTWPALLESNTSAVVINGGVFGYGLDQSFLRAEKLVEEYSPDILIVSFIMDDISRCTLSVRMGAPKPYFEVITDNMKNSWYLKLKNVPVPKVHSKSLFRQLFEKSYLMHFIMIRINPEFWLLGTHADSRQVHKQGFQVAQGIVRELEEIAVKKNLRIILLAQYNKELHPLEVKRIGNLFSLVNKTRIQTLDLYPYLKEIKLKNPDEYSLYFDKTGHMTAFGNMFVASVIKDYIFISGKIQ
jgi:hypothetical protein